MLTFMKRVSRFENHIDTSIERFLFHQNFWVSYSSLSEYRCHLGGGLHMYNGDCFANRFHIWLAMNVREHSAGSAEEGMMRALMSP